MPESAVADRILEDCRKAVREVRFGFGSKRQVWAFEEQHTIDAAGLLSQLSPLELLQLALHFHEEFAAVTNPWRVRERMERLIGELMPDGSAEFLDHISQALVDEHLALRHWLLAGFVSGPPLAVFDGLQDALNRAYIASDQFAILARLRPLAEKHGWMLGADASRDVAVLAQFAQKPEERQQALDLLATFGGPSARPVLTRAARGDAEEGVRAYAAGLLER
ncbi:MAG: hypothetical protein JO247_11110 [Chloroflexi bacterium]|nr:hypothetical protein [Chloroflexota bacterium]